MRISKLIWALPAAILLTGCGEAPVAATPTPTATATPIVVQILPTPTITPVPTAEPCPIQAADFIADIEDRFDEWDDAVTIASSTARVNLGPAVATLQAIRRDVEDLEPPECAEPVQTAFVQYMDKLIEAFLAFMTDEPDSAVTVLMNRAGVLLDDFAGELAKLKLGTAPYD